MDQPNEDGADRKPLCMDMDVCEKDNRVRPEGLCRGVKMGR